MINKPRQIPALCRVHNRILINPEHIIRPDALRHVHLLPMVGHGLPHRLAHILNNKLLGGYIIQREQAPIMNARLGELERLLPQLQLAELEHLVYIVRGDESTLQRPRLSSRARRATRGRWRARLQMLIVLTAQARLRARMMMMMMVRVVVVVLSVLARRRTRHQRRAARNGRAGRARADANARSVRGIGGRIGHGLGLFGQGSG